VIPHDPHTPRFASADNEGNKNERARQILRVLTSSVGIWEGLLIVRMYTVPVVPLLECNVVSLVTVQVLTAGLKRGTELLGAAKAEAALSAGLPLHGFRNLRGPGQRKNKELTEVVRTLRNQVHTSCQGTHIEHKNTIDCTWNGRAHTGGLEHGQADTIMHAYWVCRTCAGCGHGCTSNFRWLPMHLSSLGHLIRPS
jgi:hypothetical protein